MKAFFDRGREEMEGSKEVLYGIYCTEKTWQPKGGRSIYYVYVAGYSRYEAEPGPIGRTGDEVSVRSEIAMDLTYKRVSLMLSLMTSLMKRT